MRCHLTHPDASLVPAAKAAPDALVAGHQRRLSHPKKPLADTTDAEFDHLISLNTRSAFNTLRATARHLADNGRYVVLSTTLTSIMTGPYGLYSGSKAAVERMVLAAAKELGARASPSTPSPPAPSTTPSTAPPKPPAPSRPPPTTAPETASATPKTLPSSSAG